MGFKPAGFQRTLRNLSNFGAEALAEIEGAIGTIQTKVVEHAKSDHQAPRVKIKGKRKKKILASEGGKNRVWNVRDKSPRYGDISSRLTGSIKARPVKRRGNFLRGKVLAGAGGSVGYAPHVEFGGAVARGGSKRAGSQIILGFRRPHPFMRPAMRHGFRYEKEKKVFERAMQRAMRNAPRG